MGYPIGILLLTGSTSTWDRYPRARLLTRRRRQPGHAETLYSHLLKSNCLVTGQPDWAMVVLRYRRPHRPRRPAALHHLLPPAQRVPRAVRRAHLRDVLRQCQPASLSVWARYTRRGGLDINPYRRTPCMPVPAPTSPRSGSKIVP